jgi:hypothetical protein
VATTASRVSGDRVVAIEYRPRRVLEEVAPEEEKKTGILRRRVREIVEVRMIM